MRKHRKLIGCAVVGAVAAALTAGSASAHEGSTCSGLGGIAVHGQHVVGDYVIGGSGIGSGLTWPYAGTVGSAVGGEGAAIPGGPGPGFHFVMGFAPGASFCNDQAHPNGFTAPGNVPTPGNR